MNNDMEFDNYSSHLAVFEKIFSTFKINTVLEFGLGNFSTSFFVSHSQLVVSVEQESKEWLEKIKIKINSEKWFPVFQPDPREIFRRFDDAGQNFDLVFSDGQASTRCLVANMAMERNVPLILLHDAEKIWYYQWNLLDIPANYFRFDFRHQQGNSKVTSILTNNNPGVLENSDIQDHERILQLYSSPRQPVFQIRYDKVKSLLVGTS